jgi:hypothetical protein
MSGAANTCILWQGGQIQLVRPDLTLDVESLGLSRAMLRARLWHGSLHAQILLANRHSC